MKKLIKKWYFWVMLILIPWTIFTTIGSFVLASKVVEYEEGSINKNEATLDYNERMRLYLERQVTDELKDEAMDFALYDAKYNLPFKENVPFTSGDLAVNFAKVDKSGMLASQRGFEGIILVGVTFTNNTDDEVVIDSKSFFARLEDGYYPFFDSAWGSDVKETDGLVTVPAKTTADFVVQFGTNEEIPTQQISVRFGDYQWE